VLASSTEAEPATAVRRCPTCRASSAIVQDV
jgi:hypothetical protein